MSELDTVLQEAQELIDKYNDVAQSSIPTSIKEAQKWSLVIEGIEIAASLVEYPGGEEQRKLDKTRLVTLEGALLVLADMQTDILAVTVSTPREIIYQAFGGLYANIIRFINDWGADLVLLLAQTEGGLRIPDLVIGLLVRAGRLVISIFAISQLVAGITVGMKQRNDYAKLMRKQALQQRNGPRYRVKRSHRV